MIYILSWPSKKHQNILFRPLHSELKKIQRLFKDLHMNLRTFQGKMEFKDFSRTSPKIQGLFKTVQTLCLHLSDTFAYRSAHNNLFLMLRGIHKFKKVSHKKQTKERQDIKRHHAKRQKGVTLEGISQRCNTSRHHTNSKQQKDKTYKGIMLRGIAQKTFLSTRELNPNCLLFVRCLLPVCFAFK